MNADFTAGDTSTPTITPTITTGVSGQRWRAQVTPWGGIQPWDGRPLEWYVAADDRWHVPARESAVRQQRVEGTAVAETRVRVPTGDVVQRVYSVASAGGLTVIEIENESTLPVAIAFDRRDVKTERPVGDLPIEGIDLPDESFVLPLGHAATIRIALAHDESGPGPLPAGLPTSTQVARGWLAVTERASRFVLPEGTTGGALVDAIGAERCELILGSIARASDDPAAFSIGLGELVRMGEQPDHWVPELADAVEVMGPHGGWMNDAALDAAARVLHVARERRACDDIARIVAGRFRTPRPASAPGGVAMIPWLEQRLAMGGVLFPDGYPADWLGSNVEAYGVPTSVGSAVSIGVRWHGDRPAVLWEQTGPPQALSSPTVAPHWSTLEVKGETLWPAPPGAEPIDLADDPPRVAPQVPNQVEPPRPAEARSGDDISFS